MTVWVALLRAVNVGGVNSLPMAEFRDMLVDLGLESPKTYIQSGNAVFRAPLSAPVLAQKIVDAIHARFGFRPPILMLEAEALVRTLAANPFPEVAEPTHLHAFFMDRALPDAGFAFLKALATPTERYAVRGRVLWLHLPEGIGRSKLAKRVGDLPVDITARNLRTVEALVAMAARMAA